MGILQATLYVLAKQSFIIHPQVVLSSWLPMSLNSEMVFGSHVGCGALDAEGIHWGDEVRLDDGYCGYPSSRWMDQVCMGVFAQLMELFASEEKEWIYHGHIR